MTSDIQDVLDAASEVIAGYSEHESEFSVAFVQLGTMQDLENAVDAWRAAGGRTSDEMEDDAAIDPVCGSGNFMYVTPTELIDFIAAVIPDQMSARPCQTCLHPEWLHDGGPCCGQNKTDTGGCDCKMFTPRKGTT